MTESSNVYRPVDLITLNTSGLLDYDTADLSVSCELMHNQQDSSSIDPTETIEAVQDASGSPVLVSIGNDDRLYLIRQDGGASAGWASIDLMSSFGAYDKAAAFGLSQDVDGRISICFALSKPGAATTDVFVAYMLPDDLSQTDWTDFASVCTRVARIEEAFIAESVTLATSDDGEPPLAMVAGSLDNEKLYYLVDDATAERYAFPEDVNSDPGAIDAVSMGYVLGQRAVFYLYDVGKGQTLACTTLPGGHLGSYSYDYSPGNHALPEKYRDVGRYYCVATPTGPGANMGAVASDIYVGTDRGLFVFRGGRTSQMELVSEELKDIHQLTVTNDDQGIAIWAFCGGGRLYYIFGTSADERVWNAPILFDSHTLHLAPIRNRKRRANEVLVVNRDLNITQYWQDPLSTQWHQRTLRVDESAKTINFTSYTVQLNLAASTGEPLAGIELELKCSEWVYAVVNGEYVSLDQHTPTTVTTDLIGNITLIYMCSDLSCPTLHFSGELLDEQLNVYPLGKVHRDLGGVSGGSDLRAATTERGKPVVPSKYADGDEGVLDAVAFNVGRMTGSASDMMEGSPTCPDAVFTTWSASSGPSVRSATSTQLGARMRLASIKTASAPVVGNVVDEVDEWFTSVGDAMKYLESQLNSAIASVEQGVLVFQDGAEFVIDEIEAGLKMTARFVDGTIVTFVVDTFQMVYKAMTWLFEMIEVGLEMLLEWLGYLFDWGEILEIADQLGKHYHAIIDEMDEAVEPLVNLVQELGSFIDGVKIDPESVGYPAAMEELAVDVTGNPKNGAGALKSAASNWGLYHTFHGGILDEIGPWLDGNFNKKLEDAMGSLFAQNVFMDEEAVSAIIMQLFDDLQAMDSEAIFEQMVELLTVSSTEVVVEALNVVVGMLAEMLESFRKCADEKIEIPLFSDLMELFVGDMGFTVLRVLTVIFAIPLRIMYKTITGNNLKKEYLDHVVHGLADALRGATLPFGDLTLRASSPLVLADGGGSEKTDADENSYDSLDSGLIKGAEALGYTYVVFQAFDTYLQPIFAALKASGEDMKAGGMPWLKTIASFTWWGATSMRAASYTLFCSINFQYTPITPYTWASFGLSSLQGLLTQCAANFGDSPAKTKFLQATAVVAGLGNVAFQSVIYGMSVNSLNRAEKESLDARFSGNILFELYSFAVNFPFGETKGKSGATPAILAAVIYVVGNAHFVLVAMRPGLDRENKVVFRIY